jgi:hypothetical protein
VFPEAPCGLSLDRLDEGAERTGYAKKGEWLVPKAVERLKAGVRDERAPVSISRWGGLQHLIILDEVSTRAEKRG